MATVLLIMFILRTTYLIFRLIYRLFRVMCMIRTVKGTYLVIFQPLKAFYSCLFNNRNYSYHTDIRTQLFFQLKATRKARYYENNCLSLNASRMVTNGQDDTSTTVQQYNLQLF
jgi:hypothetical protein